MIYKTFEEMCDDETICDYCEVTDYGICKSSITPDGYWAYEGEWCEDAYECYLDNYNISEQIIKYQNNVILTNKEDF